MRNSCINFVDRLFLYACLLCVTLLAILDTKGQSHTISVSVNNGKSTISRIENGKNIPLKADSLTLNFASAQRYFEKTTTSNVINLSVTSIPPSCGYGNGSIIVIPTGGIAPYRFTSDGLTFYNTGNFTQLSAGTYKIVVTDATGASVLSPDIVLNNTLPPVHLAAGPVTRVSGCQGLNGAITVVASGGVPPYQYSMDLVNYQSSNTFSNLAYGIYTFFVKDANGCIASFGDFSILDLLKPSDCTGYFGLTYNPAECTANATAIVYIDAENPPYTYSLDGINYQSNNEFFNLSSGVYHVWIKSASGAIRIVAFSIIHWCDINLDFIGVDAACGQSNGSLTVTASNGTPPYTYTIDGVNYQSSNIFSGLATGFYNITVKDFNGYTSSSSAEVYDRCPLVTATSTDEGCLKNDGTITATAVKGTPPYQYSLDGVNFQGANVFGGLPAGSYILTIKDALGFTSNTSVLVNYLCMAVSAIATNVVCGNTNGTITVTPNGGTAPYQYSLDGLNFQGGNVFSGLAAGPYTITAKDFLGKTASTTATISNTPGSTIQSVSIIPASCSNNDGRVVILAAGGTIPLQYSIDGINYQPANTFTGLAANSYSVYVQDANGCVSTKSGNAVLANCPTLTTTLLHETCGAANGSITVNATNTNGFEPFQYSLDGINFQTSNVFGGLVAGPYTITLKDRLGYLHTTTATLNNSCPVVTATATASACGRANGSITATGSSGVPSYTFSIDGINFQASNIFSGLLANAYTVSIKDAAGSVTTTTAVVGDIPGPQLTITKTPASCLNNDGTITVSAAGGTPPLNYKIDGGVFQSSNIFVGLNGGDHLITIIDANSCDLSQVENISVINNLSIQAIAVAAICEGKNVTLGVNSNGALFKWSPASSLNKDDIASPVASPIIDTKYYVTATLGACIKSDSVIVKVNRAPVANAGSNLSLCFGQSAILHGTGGIHYAWMPSTYLDDVNSPNPIVTKPLSSITYSLKVSDANGCSSIAPSSVAVQVSPPARVFAGNDTSVAIGSGFQLSASDINHTGFINYLWTPSTGLNRNDIKNPTATINGDITYKITASNAAGCEGEDLITIKAYLGPEIYVPTAFTPDNDGRNDVLRAKPVGIKLFKHFIVYNRLGNQVFYTTDPLKGWDGKYKQALQDTQVFVWVAEGIDDKGKVVSRKGAVTLIR